MENKTLGEITIRPEELLDLDQIRCVNQSAFEGDYEADVVDQLRRNCQTILSLVAVDGERVVGHIFFSPVEIVQPNGNTLVGMGLGPLAVLPEYQMRGIGSVLCHQGLKQIEAGGHPFVVVLGHPGYYPRFGFEKASTYTVTSAFEGVPDDSFMICIYDKQAMEGVTGVAHYRTEFGSTA